MMATTGFWINYYPYTKSCGALKEFSHDGEAIGPRINCYIYTAAAYVIQSNVGRSWVR